MITPEELEILRKPEVQEYIREKMGELREYDRGFQHGEEGTVLFFWQDDGPLYSAFAPDGRYDPQAIADDFLRIPDCISRDSERPERGLLGMLNYDVVLSVDTYPEGNIYYVKLVENVIQEQMVFQGSTSRLALLRALEAQIGRKG